MRKAIKINLDVMNLNAGLLKQSTFRWWEYNFSLSDTFQSPIPDINIGSIENQPLGIYLHFTLPRELRTSDVDGKFPLIPNRWLVVRTCDNNKIQPKSIMIESDCPDGTNTGSQILFRHEIKEIWAKSKETTRNTFKTARNVVHLGRISDYTTWREQAANDVFLTASENGDPLFSAYYPHCKNILSYYDDMSGIDVATVSYTVIGWLSSDVNAPLYCATVKNLSWNRNGEPDINEPFINGEQPRINVSVGTTVNEAFLAILEQQLSNNPATLSMVSAILGDYVNELAKPNGAAISYDNRRCAEYVTTDGGMRFICENGTQAKEIDAINAICANMETTQNAILSLREHLWIQYWKYNFAQNFAFGIDEIHAEMFDPSNYEEEYQKLIKALTDFNVQAASLQAKITTEMKAYSSKRYYHPAEPAIIISGLDAPTDLQSDFNGSEFAFTDKTGEKFIDTLNRLVSFLQSDPIVPKQRQFEPLCLEWQAEYIDIPLDNWIFDGNGYKLKNGLKVSDFENNAKRRTVNGISPLSAHIKELIIDKLGKLSTKLGKDFDKSKLDHLKFLSQEMNGFTSCIAQRDIRSFNAPVDDIVTVKGQSIKLATVFGFDNSDDFLQPNFFPALHEDALNGTPYFELRSGMFYFTDLRVYDKFGRKLDIICHQQQTGVLYANNFPLIISDTMRGLENSAQEITEMKRYALLSPTFFNKVTIDADRNVIGYIVYSVINESILLYTNTGKYCGKVTVINGSPEYIKSDVQLDERMKKFQNSILSAKRFDNVIVQINSALSSINVAHDFQSALFGRPIALVDTSFAFVFFGEPYDNINWDSDVHPNTPEYFGQSYSFSLGAPAEREDGLIGYFTEDFLGFYKSGEVTDNTSLKFNTKTKLVLLCVPNFYYTVKTGLLPALKYTVDCKNVKISARIDADCALVLGNNLEAFITTPTTQNGCQFAFDSKNIPISTQIKGDYAASITDGTIIENEGDIK